MSVQEAINPGTEVDAVGEWQPHGLVAGGPQPWQQQLDSEAAAKAQQQQMQARWGPLLNLGFGSLGVLLTIGGPRGIGRSVTKAVVNSIVLIVIFDYVLTRVLLK